MMKLSKLQNFPKKIVSYFKEVKSEMAKVSWPTRKETVRYTITVIGISFVVSIFLGGLDYLFNLSVQQIINRF
ncbi:MAG: preprotein translocase subunit SecE [Candidatus Paceibacterota bacterium]